MAQHVLATGPITGLIPTPDPRIDGDTVDVTPDFLVFDDQETAVAVAEAIEDEHYVRGTHPVQQALRQAELLAGSDNNVDESALRAEHDELAKRVKARAATYRKGSR